MTAHKEYVVKFEGDEDIARVQVKMEETIGMHKRDCLARIQDATDDPG